MRKSTDKKFQHLHKILDTVREINRVLITEKNTSHLIKKVCDILVGTRQYFFAWILLFDKEQNIIQCECSGITDGIQEMNARILAGDLPTAYKEALCERKFVKVENPLKDWGINIDLNKWTPFITPINTENNSLGLLCVAIPIKDAQHPKEQLTVTDIGNNIGFALEKIKQQEEINTSENRYRNFVNNLSDALFILQGGLIKFANPMLCELSGFSEEELIGKDYSQFIAPKEIKKINSIYLGRIKEEEINKCYESLIRNKEGQLIPVEVTTIPIEYDDQPAFQIILRDISDYKNILQKLEKNKERFRFFSKSAFEGIIIHDNGIILDVNDALLKLSGYKRDDLIGENLLTKIVTDEDRQKVIDKIKKQEQDPFTIKAIKENGEIAYAEIEAKEIIYKGKRVRIAAVRDISERYYLQQEVKQTQQKLSRLLDNLPGMAFTCLNNPNWEMRFISEGCFKILGYHPHELIDNRKISFNDLIHPDNRSYVWETIQKAIQKKQPFELEFRAINKQKKEIWLCERGTAVYNDNEILLEGFISDITQLKLYEIQLLQKNKQLSIEKERTKEDKQKYQALFTNSTSVKYLINSENGAIEDANQAACKFYGYSYDRITSMNITEINTHSFDVIKQGMIRAKSSQQTNFNYKHQLADGSVRDVEIYSSPVEIAGKSFLYSIVHDITDRKELEKKNQMLSKAIDSSPVSIVITDANGDIEYVNPFFEQKTGYTLSEVLGENPRVLKSEKQDWEFYKNMWDTILAGKNWYGEFHNRKKNGELYWEQASISPVYGESGSIEHFIAVKEDVTDKKQTLSDLQFAKEKAEESDRLKSSFLANMSHEIRTPMNGILGFTELLKDPSLTGGQQQEFIEIIQSSGDRMLNTINDIIDISKIESGLEELRIKQINLSSFMQKIYSFFLPMMNEKGLEFSIVENNGNPIDLFYIDPDKLNSILINLIKNAFKFTNSGNISFGYHMNEKNIIFFVKDTGVGIPIDRQKAIFERFVQADIADSRVFEGSGLGLAITKSYVEMMGGNIQLESQIGVGTSMSVSLPINKSMEEKSMAPEQDLKLNSENKKVNILIAENDPTSVELLLLLLKNTTKKLWVVENGKEAIEAIKEHPDIDLIIMDIKMPIMDGYTATQKIREFNKKVKIIAQTAFAQTEESIKAIEMGCNDYISKPIDKKKLLQSIQNLFV